MNLNYIEHFAQKLSPLVQAKITGFLTYKMKLLNFLKIYENSINNIIN